MLRVFVLTFASVVAGAMPASSPAARQPAARTRATIDSATLEVRQIYRAIEAAIRAGALRRVDTTFQCDSEALDYQAHWYADSRGVIRRLDLGVGTDDHAEQLSFYYDSKQRLRFAFAKRGAVVGTTQEERAYYAPNRTLLARRVNWIHGPHYQFAPLAPVWDPAAWRRAACD